MTDLVPRRAPGPLRVSIASLLGLVALGVASCGPAGGDVAPEPSTTEPSATSDAPEAGVLELAVEMLPTPAPAGALAPELTRIGGAPALTWIETSETGGARLRLAHLGAAPPGPPVTVTPASGRAGEAPELFANWADRPGVVQGGSSPDGPLYAWWLAKSGEGTYAYSVHVARSTDGGVTWAPLGLLHGDDTPAEHGFVTLLPEGEGVRAFWLDGRATARGEAMTLRTVRITDRVERDTEELLDASVCDCCNTTAVTTADGPLVVYRDRTADEIRDHSVVRRTAGGWSEPDLLYRDGWKIPACPVNGPAAVVSGEQLWVTWFTGADGDPRVFAAASTDGGRTFSEPLLVDGESPLGRLDLAPDGDGGAVVSWLARSAGEGGAEAAIRLRRLTADGRLGPVVEVARAAGSRASGVPRLLADGDRLLVAWVEPAEGSRAGAIRVVRVAAADVPAPG